MSIPLQQSGGGTSGGGGGSVTNVTASSPLASSGGNTPDISITSSTGSGAVVLATSPSLTTPTLGVATVTTVNKVAVTAPATGSTLTIADGKTLTSSNTLTFTGTDGSSVAVGTGGTVQMTSGKDAASGYAGLTAGIMLKDAEKSFTRNAQTGTSYAIADGDRAKTITSSNSANAAFSLPQAGASSLFIDGWYCTIKNISATGSTIVTPATSTISGATVMVIPPGGSATIFSDGTNYQYVGSVRRNLMSVFVAHGGATLATGAAIVNAANQVRALQVTLDVALLLSQVVYAASATVAASTITLGWYTPDGSNKLVDSGTFDGGSSSAQTKSFSSVLLCPGSYFQAWSASTQTTLQGMQTGNVGTNGFYGITPGFFNVISVKQGAAANSASSGVLPSTLGAITAQPVNAPSAMWEA